MGNHSPTPAEKGNPDEVEQAVGYISKWFVQALFPYRKTDDLIRRVQNGRDLITVMSDIGLPYGKYPRLIMAYIVTSAVERAGQVQLGLLEEEEARRIPLGRSMNDFLARLGITGRGNGGSRGNLTLIREQLGRVTGSVITVRRIYASHDKGESAKVARRWDLWHDPAHPDQTAIVESHIELTVEFWEQIVKAPIPIDLDVLRRLSKPRAMDLYVWLTLKKYWLAKRPEASYTFRWADLSGHFSVKELASTNDRMNFRKELRKALADIKELWPDVGVEATADGLLVHDGTPSVRMKPPRAAVSE